MPFQIDLNVDITHEIDFDNDDSNQEEVQIQLPDLNVDISNLVELSSSNCLSLDLNSEPWREDDDIHAEPEEPNLNNGEIIDDGIRKFKTLNNDERRALYEMLLQKSVDGKLKHGITKEVASKFSVSARTVRRIWNRSKTSCTQIDASHRKVNCGGKRVYIDIDRFRDIPLYQRKTLESLACSMNMSKTTLFRFLKSGDIRRHSNAIKPFLKDENKRSRLQFCLSMLEESSIPHDPIFKGMYNIVHIDEKWFYMTKKSEKYYLLPDEEDPIRTCKSKNFIGKVMFLVALARPRFDGEGNELFSGKIGVFPLITQEPTRRTSVNRVAGTLETKPITSVNREIIKSYLIEKVPPAIKTKWPREDLRCPIFIQQDNARTHVDQNDEEFCRAATQDGFDIRLMCQPPNSPDLNVLDLGFFNAIQSLQYKESPQTIDELVSAVVKSFEVFPTKKSNHIFLTLQQCMIEIMKARGSYRYKFSI